VGLSSVERWAVLLAALVALIAAVWRANRALIGRLDSIDDNTKAWQEMRNENLQQKQATQDNTRAIEKLTERLDRAGLL
jgi:hypothetical protein